MDKLGIILWAWMQRVMYCRWYRDSKVLREAMKKVYGWENQCSVMISKLVVLNKVNNAFWVGKIHTRLVESVIN